MKMINIKYVYITLLFSLISLTISSQTIEEKSQAEINVRVYFSTIKIKQANNKHTEVRRFDINNTTKTIEIDVEKDFALQEFTKKKVNKIYKKVSKRLPKTLRDYDIKIKTNNILIENLIADALKGENKVSKNTSKYKGNAWVENISRTNSITHGLDNKHIALWASHGRYYNNNKQRWEWQRPKMFCTTEDLYTQTIVVPYLIPMLENAGANVFTPRERDWQPEEIIVDNDGGDKTSYIEINNTNNWEIGSVQGFAQRKQTYINGENPFKQGTIRQAYATKKKNTSSVMYCPNISKEGRYAVYVSYQTMKNSINDAQYIVYHKGQTTEFKVNQQMGGGTWVYLGTFDFDEGQSPYNMVVVTNKSKQKGIVTTDAVRFGGGMGNIERGGAVSGLPRCLEGARYYAQWAGCSDDIYNQKEGNDDYKDDINVRSLFTNYLSKGSIFNPGSEGLNVPIELCVALHSDAGYKKDYQSLVGTLTICTTQADNNCFNNGVSRNTSKTFAEQLLNGINKDLSIKFDNWIVRDVWDRNYSETRLPQMPSSIIEMLSHQSFPDMMIGQDPEFKFTIARSIYKTILRYISASHGEKYIVSPLTPNNFRVELNTNKAILNWSEVYDSQEETATPTAYKVYIAAGTSDFDNGTIVNNTAFKLELVPNLLYRFKVSAVNKGGESFKTEELCALYSGNNAKNIIIVNGFNRLSSPAVINSSTEQGFNIDDDLGVSYGATYGWAGRQTTFDKSKIGIEGLGGLGFGDDSLTGKLIQGNTFNYAYTHAKAIQNAGKYNIASCSSMAVETNNVNLNNYDCVDIIFGLERNDWYTTKYYKIFKPELKNAINNYLKYNGKLFVSGSYIGYDMFSQEDRAFLSEKLKVKYAGKNESQYNNTVCGMNTTMTYFSEPNEKHYAAQSSDSFNAVSPGIIAMQYGDKSGACVAYSGRDYKTVTMGFPFECITSKEQQNWVMQAILNFLLQ